MMKSSISAISRRFTRRSVSTVSHLPASTVTLSRTWIRALGVERRTFARSWHRHALDDVVDDHFNGDAVTGGMRPQPHAMSENVPRQVLDVLRIDFRATAQQQRPHLDEAPPGD